MNSPTYEEIKAKTLYAYVGNGRYLDDGVYCVLEEVRVYDRLFKLYGVNLSIGTHGLEISPQFGLDPDHVHEWVRTGKAYLTKNIDRALNEYFQYMTELYKREERTLLSECAAEMLKESGGGA